jgi:KEOPS complex subunit Cgi121
MRLVEGVADIDDLDRFLADLDELAVAHGCTVQAFDADYVADEAHLRRAVDLADRAIERGENVARERGVEVLLYAAGRRQIDEALAMGVREGECRTVVLVSEPPRAVRGTDDVTTSDETGLTVEDGEAAPDAEAAAASAVADLPALSPAPTLGAPEEATLRSFFEVGEAELAAVDGGLADLVAERVALLDVEK